MSRHSSGTAQESSEGQGSYTELRKRALGEPSPSSESPALSAIGAQAAADYVTVYDAEPLFKPGQSLLSWCLDVLIFWWVTITHIVLTAWPYLSLSIMAGSLVSVPCRYISIVAWGSILLPRCRRSARVIECLDRLFFRFWRRHVQYKVTYHRSVEIGSQYLVAEFPHGVFPLAGQQHAVVWPKIHARALSILSANVLSYIPLWRHYMSAGGCVPATRDNLYKVLADGECVSIHVGGIAEMFHCSGKDEVIVLARRRGFIRAALVHGTPILPVFHFGNSQIMTFGPRVLADLSRKLRISLGFTFGYMGLPIPRPCKIWTVAGAPIDVGPPMGMHEEGFDAKVQELHAHFSEAITSLYNTHRSVYRDHNGSWANRDLRIV